MVVDQFNVKDARPLGAREMGSYFVIVESNTVLVDGSMLIIVQAPSPRDEFSSAPCDIRNHIIGSFTDSPNDCAICRNPGEIPELCVFDAS